MNLIIHSLGGQMEFQVSQDGVLLVSRDVGPGIPDISMAMKEGYSTASEEIRMMGFGAGMGLPNMQRNCDRFDIQSRMGEMCIRDRTAASSRDAWSDFAVSSRPAMASKNALTW